jgi:hexosaminidase
MGFSGRAMAIFERIVRCRPGCAAQLLLGLCAAATTGSGRAADGPPATAPPSAATGAKLPISEDVVPRPAEVLARTGSFVVRDGTTIRIPRDRRIADIAAYFVTLVRTSHALRLSVHEAHRPGGLGKPAGTRGIIFHLDPAAPGSSPEAYELDVSPGRALVSARETQGLFYGAVTLWQLSSAHAAAGASVVVPALHISDAPRFRWRGLMLDSARHFQTPEFIEHYIDWMALHKLNMLGWHLTDDQGWRLEIRRYPRLTQVGAWRVPAGAAPRADIDPATGRPRLYGGFYTQQQVRRIVAHAAARNVTIVPEIDVPGHATAAIAAYPALGSVADPPRAVPADWGIYPNLFNVDESTFDFIEHVLDEVMELFPGEYIHLGGDEAVKDQWRASAHVQARMHELGVPNEEALQGYFTRRLGEYLAAHGRRLVGWDEILAGGVPSGAVVVSWRGVGGAIAAAAAGHDTVLSPAPTLYLDNRQGAGPNEPPGRGQVITLRDIYDFDPLPGTLHDERQHLLGVQANLWTEHVRTEQQAAYMTWPRAAALAEIGWSPAERLNWAGFVARLPGEFDRYRALGIRYSDDVFLPPRTLGPYDRHMSQDLESCSRKVLLNLEDDAPLAGPRAVFLVDVENPCWMFPAADLSQVTQLTAAVGQVPFNFQLGSDREAIQLEAPHSVAGELEVRLDRCDGEPIAVLPLAPAVDNDAVTVLPAVSLRAASGQPLGGSHALCLRFTQRSLDPLWVIDWVQLSP